jgi:hypothetical protein
MTYAGVCYDGPLEGQSHVSQCRRFCVPVMPTFLQHDSNGYPCNIGAYYYRWSRLLRKWVVES